MSSLAQHFVNQGFNQGITQGITQGISKGKQQSIKYIVCKMLKAKLEPKKLLNLLVLVVKNYKK